MWLDSVMAKHDDAAFRAGAADEVMTRKLFDAQLRLPHTEGGRNPVKHFETSLDDHDCTEAERDAFYANKMIDLVGALQ